MKLALCHIFCQNFSLYPLQTYLFFCDSTQRQLPGISGSCGILYGRKINSHASGLLLEDLAIVCPIGD